MSLYIASTALYLLVLSNICYKAIEASPAYCDNTDGCGYDDQYYQSKNWMGKIADDTRLWSLSFPGTHDSMARYGKTEFDKPLAVCQSMNLKTQLEHGIRAFDIRNRHINDAFAIHHEMIYQHARFGNDVAKVMSDFLDENPSETIIMHHQKEYQDEAITRPYDETMDWYISLYPKLTKLPWGKSKSISMTLGEVRGKIMINYDQTMWENKSEQNDWTVESCAERDEKWNGISSLIDDARSNPDDSTLYVNYVSGNGGAEAYNPFSGCHPGLFVKGLAERLNGKLNDKIGLLGMDNDNNPRIGIIFMDFPGPRVISSIIKQNPFRCHKSQTEITDSRNVVTSCDVRTALQSGDTIALRSMCGARGWVSNYCTINCDDISRPKSCPGTVFTKDKIKNCGSESMIIVAEGRAKGEKIHSGDVIGLYYAKGYWMSCSGIDQDCTTKPCPGSTAGYTKAGWVWPSCAHEKFHIEFAKKNSNSVIFQHDEVAIRRNDMCGSSGYMSVDDSRITLRTCPTCNGSNGWKTKYCRCEAFEITTFGPYYGL